MKITLALLFLTLSLASEKPEAPALIELTVGVGKTLHLTEPIGSVWLADGSLTKFARIREGDTERKILLTPLRTGLTDLVVNRPDAKRPPARYRLKIHPRGDVDSIRKQMSDESGAGLPVEWVELRTGEAQEFALPTLDGPIFLTDTNVLDYVRVADSERPRLSVHPRSAGITDLTVFGPDGGEPLKRFYFEVRD